MASSGFSGIRFSTPSPATNPVKRNSTAVESTLRLANSETNTAIKSATAKTTSPVIRIATGRHSRLPSPGTGMRYRAARLFASLAGGSCGSHDMRGNQSQSAATQRLVVSIGVCALQADAASHRAAHQACAWDSFSCAMFPAPTSFIARLEMNVLMSCDRNALCAEEHE